MYWGRVWEKDQNETDIVLEIVEQKAPESVKMARSFVAKNEVLGLKMVKVQNAAILIPCVK
jgi:hypothetical protein